jgi:hypothetical protein
MTGKLVENRAMNSPDAIGDRPLRVLAFVGSPRNEDSWTYKIMCRLEERMQAIRPTEVEYVFIQKTGVPFCDGCLSCVNASPIARRGSAGRQVQIGAHID